MKPSFKLLACAAARYFPGHAVAAEVPEQLASLRLAIDDLTKTPPFSPPSGLATGSFNGLHAKSKFLAFGHMAEILKKWTGFTPKNYRGHFQQSGQ